MAVIGVRLAATMIIATAPILSPAD